jgi:hypothetical protein
MDGVRPYGRIQVDELYDVNGNLVSFSSFNPLVTQYVHAGAAVQNLDILGLDSNAVGGYRLVLGGKNPLGVIATILLYVNANYVDGNYSGEVAQARAAGISGFTLASPAVMDGDPNESYHVEACFYVTQHPISSIIFCHSRARYINTGGHEYRTTGTYGNFAAANLTEIRIRCAEGAAFDAGTKYWLFKNSGI